MESWNRFKKWWFKPKYEEYIIPIFFQALLGLVFLAFALPEGDLVSFFLGIFGILPFAIFIAINPMILICGIYLWGNPMGVLYG